MGGAIAHKSDIPSEKDEVNEVEDSFSVADVTKREIRTNLDFDRRKKPGKKGKKGKGKGNGGKNPGVLVKEKFQIKNNLNTEIKVSIYYKEEDGTGVLPDVQVSANSEVEDELPTDITIQRIEISS